MSITADVLADRITRQWETRSIKMDWAGLETILVDSTAEYYTEAA